MHLRTESKQMIRNFELRIVLNFAVYLVSPFHPHANSYSMYVFKICIIWGTNLIYYALKL